MFNFLRLIAGEPIEYGFCVFFTLLLYFTVTWKHFSGLNLSEKFDRHIALLGYIIIGSGPAYVMIFGIIPHYAQLNTVLIATIFCVTLLLLYIFLGERLFIREKNVFKYFHTVKNPYIKTLQNTLGILSLLCLLWFNFRNWELSNAFKGIHWKQSVAIFIDNLFTSLPLYVGWLLLKIGKDKEL